MAVHRPSTAIPQHVLDRSDMRQAITRHDFGAVFALARKWAGISYSKIAEACGIKPERVGTLARGEGSVTSYEKIAQIADALRIPGHMLGLAPRVWESATEPLRQFSAPLQEIGDETVLRRDFLRASAVGAGMALGLSTVAEAGTGRRIGADVPNQLRQRAARLRRLDNILGGGDTYQLYLGEYQNTKALLRESTYTEATGRQLLSVLAEQAQQAGWAAFDAGDHPHAAQLYQASYTAATQASDASLAGNALAFLAYQRTGADPTAAVKTAAESCRTAGPDVPATVRALLHERLAWAHAVAGNANDAERALDAAEAALSCNAGDPQPDWAAWVDQNELRIMTGRCWTELERPLRAVPILRKVLANFDDAYARDKALYLSWLAGSCLTAGEIEEAATVASRVLDLSAGVASVRPQQQILPVLTQLAKHRALPAVTEVLEKVRG